MSDNPKLKKNGGEGSFVGNALRTLKKSGKVISPIILDLASNVKGLGGLSKLADAIRGDEEMESADKAYLLAEIQADISETQEITKRWEADTKTNYYLPNNIRPLSLAFLTLSLIVLINLDSALENFTVKEQWIDLLSILLLTIYTAYFGGRSLEKIQKIRK